MIHVVLRAKIPLTPAPRARSLIVSDYRDGARRGGAPDVPRVEFTT